IAGTINLTAPLPALSTDLTNQNPGAAALTVRRSTAVPSTILFSLFSISRGATVSLSGLTVTGGSAKEGDGGGISNNGRLTLRNSVLSGNSTAGSGGGIRNHGTLTLSNSTLAGNSARLGGGAIFNDGTLTVNNSTLVDNTANYGGGISNSGTLTANN